MAQLGASRNEGPSHRAQIAGLLLEGHPQKGPPIYRNSHMPRSSFFGPQGVAVLAFPVFKDSFMPA